jgi:methionyl-tRNA synthetase
VPARGELLASDLELLEKIKGYVANVGAAIEGYRFKEALTEMMRIAYAGNKFLAETEPWHLIKTDEKRVATILNLCAHICAVLAGACEPFMPQTAAKLRTMLNISSAPKWSDLSKAELVAPGTAIQKIGLLFTKLDDVFAEQQNAELEARAKTNAAEKVEEKPLAAAAPETSFDEFQKMDIRTCTILTAEPVKGTDKLMHLTVDTGLDTRTIVSGVALHFTPEQLIGKRALCLVNLPPRKFKGIPSQGMLLFAEDADGKMHLVGPDDSVINGATVK